MNIWEAGSPIDQSFSYIGFGIAFLIGLFSNLMFFGGVLRKMNKNSKNVSQTSEETQSELKNLDTKDLLPPANFQSVIPSVVEQTTTNLEKVRRN